MAAVLTFEDYVVLLVSLLALGIKVYALVNALLWTAEAYAVTQKLSKQAWVAILGLGVLAELLFKVQPVNPINLAATIAALVYLLDVRPALYELTGRSGGAG